MSERQPLLADHAEAAYDGPASAGSLAPGAKPEPALERNFSFIAALGLAFTLLNTWTAMFVSSRLVMEEC